MTATGRQLADEACAPFDAAALREALVKAKQDAEQAIDKVTVDVVIEQGFDAAAKEKAAPRSGASPTSSPWSASRWNSSPCSRPSPSP